METFEAYPNHRALAALSTVAQQINKNVNQETVARAREACGDHGNKATREMLKTVLEDEVGWKVVESDDFQGRRAVLHGGHREKSSFGLMYVREPKPCYFQPLRGVDVDHHGNVWLLTRMFDVVFVKRDFDFELPEDLFCCLYNWPAQVKFEEHNLLSRALGDYTLAGEKKFVAVLRKTKPLGKFFWQE